MTASGTALVKFHASSVGNLLVGGNAITTRQLDRLRELESRQLDPSAKPLTAAMQKELEDLIEKRDAPYEFGATAMSLIRSTWLEREFGYREPLVTSELIKGLLCEDEAIAILSRQVPGGFRFKNEQKYEDDWFVGTPDIVDDWVEDIKCSWSLRTFFDVRKPDPIYYAQGQVYMALTGRSNFRLAHILCETPFELVEEEKKRFFFKFNCDEENPHYQEALANIDSMHDAVGRIPESSRVKTFEFARDDDYLATLRQRVEQARDVYATLSLDITNE